MDRLLRSETEDIITLLQNSMCIIHLRSVMSIIFVLLTCNFDMISELLNLDFKAYSSSTLIRYY